MPKARKSNLKPANRPANKKPLDSAASDSASTQVFRALCKLIADRHLAPGHRITERDICSEYQTERSVAREVLTKLEQRGLITRSKNRSAIVVRFTVEQIQELLNIREVLDGLAARLASENAPEGFWDDLILTADTKLPTFAANNNYEEFMEVVETLILKIRQGAKSTLLSEFLELIDERVRYVNRRTTLIPGRMQTSIVNMKALLSALRAGKAEDSERLRRDQIRGQRELLKTHGKLLLDA